MVGEESERCSEKEEKSAQKEFQVSKDGFPLCIVRKQQQPGEWIHSVVVDVVVVRVLCVPGASVGLDQRGRLARPK